MKLLRSFKYAINGIFLSIKSERNMKIHIAVMITVILAGIFFKIDTYEWIACIICFMLVIGSEMFNTAIEESIDIAMPQKNVKAGKAKDISAGAVLIFAVCSACIGLIIFVPKIIQYIN